MPLTIQKMNLEAAAHDVCYEMLRLGDALTNRKQFCSGGREASLAQLLLEAFLLHYRNIRDFLMNADKYPDDITARHFNLYWQVSSWKDHVAKAKSGEGLRESELINKLLAHVSYSRAEARSECPTGVDWPLTDMYQTAKSEFVKFVEALPPERQSLFSQCTGRLHSSSTAISQDGISNSTGSPQPHIRLGGFK